MTSLLLGEVNHGNVNSWYFQALCKRKGLTNTNQINENKLKRKQERKKETFLVFVYAKDLNSRKL